MLQGQIYSSGRADRSVVDVRQTARPLATGSQRIELLDPRSFSTDTESDDFQQVAGSQPGIKLQCH
jgi:hypothetical protein